MPTELDLSPPLRTWQFGLGSILATMTGASVVFGLMKWLPDKGFMAGLFLVGAAWAGLAVRARRPRVAYVAVAVASGSLLCAALDLPLSPLHQIFHRPMRPMTWARAGESLFWWQVWSAVLFPLLVNLTLLIMASVGRRWIQIPGHRSTLGLTALGLPASGALLGILVMGCQIVFWLGGAMGVSWKWNGLADVLSGLAMGSCAIVFGLALAAIAGAMLAICCVHIAGPILFLTILALRWVHPAANNLTAEEWAVARAIWRLQSAGVRLIGVPQIAEALGWDKNAVLPRLWRPIALGVVNSTLTSYRCPRRPRRTR